MTDPQRLQFLSTVEGGSTRATSDCWTSNASCELGRNRVRQRADQPELPWSGWASCALEVTDGRRVGYRLPTDSKISSPTGSRHV
jgi:hypothetical protein